MNYIKDISLHNSDEFNMVIEIIKNSKDKKELIEPLNKELITVRKIKLKYPFYYGCFPQTLAGDGDALDVILLTKKEHNELDIVKVSPIGTLKTIDEGFQDDKVFVIDLTEPLSIKEQKKIIKEAYKFLTKYKGKFQKFTQTEKQLVDKEETLQIIAESNKKFVAERLPKKQTPKIILA